MPNWVLNKLYVVGPAHDIADFKVKNRDSYYPVESKVDRLKTTKLVLTSNSSFPIKDRSDGRQSGKRRSKPVVVDLSFDRIMPVPLAVTKKPYINLGENCFEDPIIPWCVKHWGCKWDASDPKLVHESKRRLFYCFSTPWEPPSVWLKYVSKKYPRLRFNLHFWDSQTRVIIRSINGQFWIDKLKPGIIISPFIVSQLTQKNLNRLGLCT